MSEWRETSIGSLCTIKHGFAYKGEYITNEKCSNVLVTPGNFTLSGGFKMMDKPKYYKGPVEKEYILKEGDLIVTMTDLSKGIDTLGYSALVPKINGITFHHNQRIGLIENISEEVDKGFLYWTMRTRPYQRFVANSSSGTTVHHTSPNNISKYSFLLPTLVEQKEIASILSSLDDKIAVNRRICENLEAQAQALFKHWFIDFAPFLDKPSGKAERKNGQFVESELGMIPEGWRVGTLSEIADINPSRTIKKGTISTYLDMKNMPTSGSFPINWENKEFVGGMKFKNGDTLMARITPCLENGKVAYANFLRDGEIAFGSTEYIVMTAKESIFPEFLYTLCLFPSFVNYAVKNMNGSSGRQRVSGETISNYRMVIAPESVYSSVRPIFQEYMLRIRECGFENLRLSTLRDTLLPKLMSGQIKV
jgi:type I restriction enzyme S subunit